MINELQSICNEAHKGKTMNPSLAENGSNAHKSVEITQVNLISVDLAVCTVYPSAHA